MKSPCVLICSIDQRTGYCFGCGRTRDEIAGWIQMSDTERETIMAGLKERLAGVVRRPRRETKRKRMARHRISQPVGEKAEGSE